MATITKQTIKVDLTPGRVYPVLHISQGDVGLEALEFQIYQNNQPYTIPSEVTAINIDGMTPVGVFSYACTWTGNIVTAGVTATMTAERGIDICELALYDAANNKVGTCNFIIAVEESPFTNAHVSTSDMATIMAAATEVQQNTLLSKSWAVGDTGIRTGEDTNNSEYWANMAESWAVGGTGKRTGENTNNSEYWSTVSHEYANTVSYKKVFPNAAAVIADTTLVDGQICRTLGYTSPDDDGGLLYQIGTAATDSLSLTLSNGLYANAITDVVTPQMFGAIGDGVTDDTAAFNRALASGFDVFVPTSKREKYLITDTLHASTPQTKRLYGIPTFRGGIDASQSGLIWNNADDSASMFDIDVEMFNIAGLSFDGENVGTFLYANREAADVDVEINNCRITNFNLCFDLTGRGLTVTNCNIASCKRVAALSWDDDRETSTTHPAQYGQRGIRFANNRLHSILNSFILVNSGHCYGLHFVNNLIDNGRGFLVSCQTDEAWNWNISGNTINGLQNSSFVMRFLGGIKDSVISNNVITAESDYWSGAENLTAQFLSLYNCNGLILSNNVFDTTVADKAIILRGAINKLTIAGNLFNNLYGSAVYWQSDASTTGNAVIIANNQFVRNLAGDASLIGIATTQYPIEMTNSYVKNNVYVGYSRLFQNGVSVSQPALDPSTEESALVANVTQKDIAANTDLNNLKTRGMYACASSAIASSLTNCPYTSSGFTMEVATFGYYVTQMINAGTSIYVRKSSSGGFAAWTQLT